METFCSEKYFNEKPDDYKNTGEDERVMINGKAGATSIPVTVKETPNFRLTDETRMIFWSEIEPVDDGKVWDLVAILEVDQPDGGKHYAVADFDYDSAMLLDSERFNSLAGAYETFKNWREENLTEKKENLKHAKN